MRKSVWIENLPDGYSVRFYTKDSSGKHHKAREWFKEWDAARRFKAQKQASLLARAQHQVDPTLKPIDIFRAYLQALGKINIRQTTLDLKYDALNAYLIGLPSMDHLTPRKLLHHYQTATYGPKNKTYEMNGTILRLRELKAFNKWCVAEGYMSSDLFTIEKDNGKKEKFIIPEGVEVGRKLELEEIKRLWDAVNPRFKCFWAFLIYTGGRFGETFKTEWKHLDLENKIWTIPAINNKTDKEKKVPLEDILIKLLKNQPRDSDRVFPKNNLYRSLSKAKTKAGIEGRLRPHDFRHTFTSHWTGDTRILMDMLGWSTPFMLKRYSHFTVENVRKESKQKGIAAGLQLGS